MRFDRRPSGRINFHIISTIVNGCSEEQLICRDTSRPH
jgi:hypothetical protein